MESVSRWFKVERGIKQGDPFLPKAFTALLEELFRKIEWKNRGLLLNNDVINELRFADDIVLISENQENLRTMMVDVFRESATVESAINKQRKNEDNV
jgi:hypothetical protein